MRKYFLVIKNALRAKDAQLAEKKFVALQHRSRAESLQANSLFHFGNFFGISKCWKDGFLMNKRNCRKFIFERGIFVKEGCGFWGIFI